MDAKGFKERNEGWYREDSCQENNEYGSMSNVCLMTRESGCVLECLYLFLYLYLNCHAVVICCQILKVVIRLPVDFPPPYIDTIMMISRVKKVKAICMEKLKHKLRAQDKGLDCLDRQHLRIA